MEEEKILIIVVMDYSSSSPKGQHDVWFLAERHPMLAQMPTISFIEQITLCLGCPQNLDDAKQWTFRPEVCRTQGQAREQASLCPKPMFAKMAP